MIHEVQVYAIPFENVDAFRITASVAAAQPQMSIPPDLATCPECLAEISDPANRRYRYPFTNCTHCGPRFTIARDIPYDRASTTMSAFVMCSSCQREYDDPLDRRFHAQPNACPRCGPSLTLRQTDGTIIISPDPIEAAATALVAGSVVAIKGLGGFHLVCDATSAAAVARLRRRKRRDEKPFAVMVRDLAEAETLALLSDHERRLLQSPARPIVLAARRPDAALAPNVAPDALLAGLMLPYTPLHHLLVNAAARPLVMTSGNVSEQPLIYRHADAYAHLGAIVDRFVTHDREIQTGCDDSVARVIADQPIVIRRARGYVPRPIRVTAPFPVPVLGCGGLLKNAICIGVGDTAHLGAHIGDLSNLDTYESFVRSIDHGCRFLRVTPEVVAYDLHPDYLSTRYALSRPEPIKIGVQHHHAHIASVMAEHGLAGPVIGVAYDGTGYGTDGTSWGGEIMIARAADFDRVATLRPIALAGGDVAIREPWRIALALVDDAFEGTLAVETLALFAALPASRLGAVLTMIRQGIQTFPAHGAGRYFDAVGALILGRAAAKYEGQVALAVNGAAAGDVQDAYGFDIDRATYPWTIDLRPMVRSMVADLFRHERPSRMAARFHNTLAAATADAVHAIADERGHMPVALSGGCFQNPLLVERAVAKMSPRFEVSRNREAPPGDGGIALGQAVVASAIAGRM